MASTVEGDAAPLVLVVDDCSELLEIYALVLEAEGFHVITRCDGKQGLDAAEAHRPDAVVLDMMMPEVDGLEFLRRLPARTPHPPRVIACSGYAQLEYQARELGAFAFLLKPVSAVDLATSVSAALDGAAESHVLETQRDHALEARDEARQGRLALLANLDLDDPALLARVNPVAQWLARFFDCPYAFVTAVVNRLELSSLAAVAPPTFTTFRAPAANEFCGDLINAGSTLVLEDAATHPSFADHTCARSGIRFYAGAPVMSPEGLALGSVCVSDTVPRRFRSEDMRILIRLGEQIGAHLAALAQGVAGPELPVAHGGIVSPAILDEVLAAELRHASRNGGGVGLAIAELSGDARDLIVADDVPRRLTLGRHNPRGVALVLGAEDAVGVRRGLSRELSVLSGAVGLRGSGAVQLQPRLGAEDIPHEIKRLKTLATQACTKSITRCSLTEWVSASPPT